MNSSFLRHTHLVWDACCIINVHASGNMSEVLQSLPLQAIVVKDVKDDETLWEELVSEDGKVISKQPINLEQYINDGLLEVTDFNNDAEAESALNFRGMNLDMGESFSAAIAMHRNWAIATDERKCTNILRVQAPQIQVVTTLELMKYWADSQKPSFEVLQEALTRIRKKGRYKPRESHNLYQWWSNYVSEDTG